MKIAIIGDIHEAWSEADVEALSASDADAILFVGDLPGYRLSRAVRIARSIARVRKPAYLIPGNHDGPTLPQLMAEVAGLRPRRSPGGWLIERRVRRLEAALGPVTLCGYSRHDLGGVTLIAARPHAMGGGLSFAPYIARRFGVRSLEESAARLIELIDEAPAERPLVILAHNGPRGLGGAPTDIWGCDFKKGGGDWGDVDLRAALDHARDTGRRVLAVVAGHMHLRTKQGAERDWHVEQGGVHHVNAARVPRIFTEGGRQVRHHVELELSLEVGVEDVREVLSSGG